MSVAAFVAFMPSDGPILRAFKPGKTRLSLIKRETVKGILAHSGGSERVEEINKKNNQDERRQIDKLYRRDY